MYSKGWNERNGGNISYIISDEELDEYYDELKYNKKNIELNIDIPLLKNKYILVTETGKYLKNVSKNPYDNLGIIKIAEDGKTYRIVWGNENYKPTSELPTHLLCHNSRLKIDQNHKVIIHNHATNIEAMSCIAEQKDRMFTRILWKIQTESIVVFPEGIGVLPWMLCGNDEIGIETAKKMEKYRLVVWSNHGILGAGKNLDETFGLIETAEKAAEIYLKVKPLGYVNQITDHQLKELAKLFKIKYNSEFLD